jgi:hypothetical protein
MILVTRSTDELNGRSYQARYWLNDWNLSQYTMYLSGCGYIRAYWVEMEMGLGGDVLSGVPMAHGGLLGDLLTRENTQDHILKAELG